MSFHRIILRCSGSNSCCSSHSYYPWVLKMIVSGVLVFLITGFAQADPYKTSYNQQGVKVSISMSATSVRVAEPFTVTYELISPAEKSLVWPAVTDQLGPFDVIDSKDLFEIPVDSGRMWRRTLTLESIHSGDLEVPELSVNLLSTDSKSVQAEPVEVINLAAQPVTITSVLEGRADPTTPVLRHPEQSSSFSESASASPRSSSDRMSLSNACSSRCSPATTFCCRACRE